MPQGFRVEVTAPPVAPLPFGLWSTVTPGPDSSHWQMGARWEPDACGAASTVTDHCPPWYDDRGGEGEGEAEPDWTKPPTGGPVWVGADPITVYTRLPCGPVGGVWEQATARATAALTAGEARAVEHAVWTGRVAVPSGGGAVLHPHLASDTQVVDGGVLVQPAADVPVAGPLPLTHAVGLLEGEMAACYGGTPVLHVPRWMLAPMAARGLVKATGGQLRTLSGSLVAAGGGYDGSGPDGSPAVWPSGWIYATGAVQGWRSPVRVNRPAESLDRASNDLVLLAERTYLIGWDCCLVAALVDLTADGGGSGE